MPSVNVKLTVPLSNEYYDIFRLKKDLEKTTDSLELRILSDSVLLNIRHNEHVQVGDHLDADPTVDSTNGTINNDLNLRDSVTVTYLLGALAPITVDTLHNKNRIIPAFNIPSTSRTATFNNFTAVTALSGSTLRTVITNNTQAHFDSLTVVIIDQSNNARMDSFKTIVNAGATQSNVKTFSSTTVVHSPFSVRVYGSSTGSGTSVPVDTNRVLSIKTVTDFSGSSITGRFPSQTIVRADSFKSSSNSVIDTGYVESGKITINFTNLGLPINSWLFFHSPDFDSAGSKLNRAFRVTTGANPPVVIRLNNWKATPSTSTIGNQYLNYDYVIRTDSSVNPASTITNGQGVKVKATLDTMKFSRLRAKLARDSVNVNRTSQATDIKHLDTITVKRALFEIITEHRIPFPMSLDISITGKRVPNLTKTIHVVTPIPAYTTGTSRKDTIQTYNQVAQLLNIVPDSIIVSGKVYIGDNVTSGAVNREDFVSTKINLRAPLLFSLPIDTVRNVVKTDPSEITISEKNKERIYERLKSVMITGKVVNHFPVPISVQFLVDSSSFGVPTEVKFYNTPSALKFIYPYAPLFINKGTTNASGIVTTGTEVNINYLLDQSEYQKIFNPRIDSVKAAIYHGLKVRLLGTGGDVQISADDFIDVKTNIEIEYFIDEDY